MSTYYSCIGLPDGANPIPGQTILTQYIMCQGDRTIDVKGCPNGKTYDPTKRICTETTQQGKPTVTVLPVKSDSDSMFCLQSYQGLIIDISLVY